MFSIGRRLGKNVFSETNTKVANYNSKLDNLIQEFRDRTLLDVQDGVQQIREDLSLDSLVCAGRVGLNQEKQCLDGTRTQILNDIVDWMNNTDDTAPRIFWLHGQAGKGKSAIAHTIALQARNLGMLGSCFCFTRVRQHEELQTKLFPTIARGLADRDLRLRPLLAKVINSDHSLADTADVMDQWEKFIVEPFSRLRGASTGNVMVVIDALDESGRESTRTVVLKALAACNTKLPANIRILLTSRPMVDISEVLNPAQHVHARSLDDIAVESTMGDIRLYISHRLKNLGDTCTDENLQQLAAKSDGVFEWARLACDFVFQRRLGAIAKKRLEGILSQGPGDGRILLDTMYTTFLKEITQESSDMVAMFRSVMRQILWSKEPLPISALDFMRDKFPRMDDQYGVGGILRLMASLLSGTTDTSTPVRPLHASFYDFLLDENRSREFFIEQEDVHRDLATGCLSIMQTCLCFNICGLETSYVLNADIADLDKRVEKNIPPPLHYACQFWAAHLHDVEFDAGLANLVGEFIAGEQILFWLEALGVSKLIKEAYWVLISAESWFQVRCLIVNLNDIIPIIKWQGKEEYKEVMMLIKDVIKFVQNFTGLIDKSTPHLYLSALPFLPANSVMARYWVPKFPGIAQVSEGLCNDWPRNEHVLQGHTEWVNSVAFSPDGRHIVSGSEDQTIQVWDAQTGGQVGNPLQGHTKLVKSVAFSPDGRHIVSCSWDQTIRVWDTQTGGQVGNPLQGHTDLVNSVAFSPDGRHIVSGSFDQTIRVWDAQTGGQVDNPLQGHTFSVKSVAFSPDGRHIVSGSDDQTIRVWDAQTGGQVGNPLQGHTNWVNSVAFSPDGRHIVSGSSDQTIQVWDAQTGGQMGNPLQGHTGSVNSVTFSPDGRHIVSGSDDHTIRVWDAQTGHQVANPLQGHTLSVNSVAFSPDGRYIVSGSSDHTIRVWDAQTGGQVGNPLQGHTSSVNSVAFSPDGRHIVSGSWDQTIQVWGAHTGGQIGVNGPTDIKLPPITFSSWTTHALPHTQSLFTNLSPDVKGDC